MNFLFFTHSLISDWNHGNAHFLRGVMRALQGKGHACRALEPADGWSRRNLLAERGEAAIGEFHRIFPDLRSDSYDSTDAALAALDGADVVIVHEWTDPDIVSAIGRARAAGGRFRLLFHDTHHRAVSADAEIRALDLSAYDGVLAFGAALRERYLATGWGRDVHVWHEAADDSLFRPHPEIRPERDLVWVGNWGDGERSAELMEFLVRPVEALGLSATIHGVRYPPTAIAALERAGAEFAGSVANALVPQVFARHRVTVHVPRRPYVSALPGIPTIRPFEALACGIPLICAPWEDAEGLFRPGHDYLVAQDGAQMTRRLTDVLSDPALSRALAANGLERIAARHSCRHRADELLDIVQRMDLPKREIA
ncbi:CgeB family protein [Brevirhabdus sp.]|uniref:CgeB family protein n=1 Tax=Brevirhabdus sp. TaxID=2004514 RepID=UPI00405873B0